MSNYSGLILGTTGLVSYWRLGEAAGATTAADAKGANTGTYTGGFTLAQAGALTDDADTAVLLNGTTGYVAIPINASLDLGDGPLSLECWFKPTNTSFAVSEQLMSRGTGEYSMSIRSGTPYFTSPNVQLVAHSSVTIADTNWHHLVTTKNGATTKVYLDGADVTVADTNATLGNGQALGLGADDGGGEPFDGTLDDCALYSVVLTLAQVARHYAVGRQAAYTYKPIIIPNRRVGPIALRRTFRAPVPPTTNLPAATTALAEVATGTGVANNASAQIQPNAATATGTGTASNAAASIAPVAGLAAGTGAANNATVSIVATSSVAAGTGAAANAQGSLVATASLATGTGAAQAAAAQVASSPSAATGTGSANQVSASIVVNGGFATGTGSAYDATVSTSGDVVALAEVAQGFGTAYDATVVIPVVGGGAGKFGRRYNPVQIAKPLEIPSPFVIAHAEVARGTGRAYDATVSWNDDDFALMLLEAA